MFSMSVNNKHVAILPFSLPPQPLSTQTPVLNIFTLLCDRVRTFYLAKY